MNMTHITTIFATLIIAGIVFATVGLPLIEDLTTEDQPRPNTISEKNWIRLDYITSDEDYTLEYGIEGGEVYAKNGEEEQRGLEYLGTIVYADDMLVIYDDVDNGFILVGDDGSGNAMSTVMGWECTVVRENGKVSVYGNNTVESTVANKWAYIPDLDGKNTVYYPVDLPIWHKREVRSVGNYAGVYGYNSIITGNYGVKYIVDDTNNQFRSAIWGNDGTLPETPENPDEPPIIGPIGPGIGIGGLGGLGGLGGGQYSTMDVTTPYVEGDWTYVVDGGVATITAYNGTGGNIVIPATLGGYTVEHIGNGDPIIGQITNNSTITITNGPKYIGINAFKNITTISGTIEIPESVLSIGESAFEGCNRLTGLILNEGVIAINDYAFKDCTRLRGTLFIPSTTTFLGYEAFANVGFINLVIKSNTQFEDSMQFDGAGISYVLNLGTATYTASSYGLSAETVRSDVPSFAYISEISPMLPEKSEGAEFELIGTLPLIIAIGFVLAVVGWFFIRK